MMKIVRRKKTTNNINVGDDYVADGFNETDDRQSSY